MYITKSLERRFSGSCLDSLRFLLHLSSHYSCVGITGIMLGDTLVYILYNMCHIVELCKLYMYTCIYMVDPLLIWTPWNRKHILGCNVGVWDSEMAGPNY